MATPSLAGGGQRTPGHRGGGLRNPLLSLNFIAIEDYLISTEREGVEPSVASRLRRFSRPMH